MSARRGIQAAVDLGRRAARAGARATDCPYPEKPRYCAQGNKWRDLWMRGYREARQDQRKARP